MINNVHVTHHTIRQSGFELSRRSWFSLKRYRTGQGSCPDNLHECKPHLYSVHLDLCVCGQQQTVIDVVNKTQKLQFTVSIQEGGDKAVYWIVENTAIIAVSGARGRHNV